MISIEEKEKILKYIESTIIVYNENRAFFTINKEKYNKIQKYFSEEEIIEIQKYIITNSKYTYKLSIPIAIIFSEMFSNNKTLIFDDKLLDYYKKYIFALCVSSIAGKFIIDDSNKKYSQFGKYQFGDFSMFRDILDVWFYNNDNNYNKKVDFLYNKFKNDSHIMRLIFKQAEISSLQLFIIFMFFNDDDELNKFLSKINNDLKNLLIEKWSDFGIEYINNEMK